MPNTLIVLRANQQVRYGAGAHAPLHPRRSRARRERRHRRTTDTDAYPSGWKYTLHLGTLQDLTLIRYDNAHEDTKGHELHTAAGDADVEFPGMEELIVEFWASADEYWDTIGGNPPRPY